MPPLLRRHNYILNGRVMSASYCSQLVVTDISGIFTTVGDPGAKFQFQVGPSPPACFFTIGGIYSQRTVSPAMDTFNRLYNRLRTVDSSAVDPFNNTNMNIFVQQLSFGQQQYYQQLIRLFQKVYGYNLLAYAYAGKNRTTPFYYTFESSSELSQYREANGLINKLYNVDSAYPVTSLFFLPFPPFCN